MDLFTIATGSIGLAGTITKVLLTIVEFTRDAQYSKSDLDALSAELQALSTILYPLGRSISGSASAAIPITLIAQVNTTLSSCSAVVEQIEENIRKYQRDRIFSKLEWVIFGQADTNKLRTSLECYNTALSLGMHAISVYVITLIMRAFGMALTVNRSVGQSVKEDTSVIRHDTAAIRLNTDEILARVNSIRRATREPRLNIPHQVEQWIEDMAELSSYAETTYQGTVFAPTELETCDDALPRSYEELGRTIRLREQGDEGKTPSFPGFRPPPHSYGKADQPGRVDGMPVFMGSAGPVHSQKPGNQARDARNNVSDLVQSRMQSSQAWRAQRNAETRAKAHTNETGRNTGDDESEHGTGAVSEVVKPIVLEGIFNMPTSTISMRPLRKIDADIRRVLKLVRVNFTTGKGGFTCYYSPHIGTGEAPQNATDADTVLKLGGVVFKLLILKVPVVRLHGLEFKKVGGDAWHYAALVRLILDKLKL